MFRILTKCCAFGPAQDGPSLAGKAEQGTRFHGLHGSNRAIGSKSTGLRLNVLHLPANHACATRRLGQFQHQCHPNSAIAVGHVTGQYFKSKRQQAIARKNRCRLVEFPMNRRLPAPQIIIVHGGQVVMGEGIAMHTLQCRAHAKGRSR